MAVLRRHVLAALARGVEAADEDVARAALGRIDWVLRCAARRRLEHALIDASLATHVMDGSAASQRLRLQAAALLVSGQAVDDTETAYARLRSRAPIRAPLATIGALAVAVALCAGVVVATVEVATTARAGSFTRPTPPDPVGAFRDGGAPLHDPAIEQVLAVELPALVSHPASDPAGRRAKVVALRDHAAFASRTELAAAWRRMIDSVDRWRDPEAPSNVAELRVRVLVVSDQLAAAELGYYLEPALADRHRRRPGIYTYRVDDVGFVRANDDRMRVLGVRRLDRLDDGMAALGLASEELEDPIVLLDQIDAKVARDVMPVLAGRDYALGEDAPRTRAGRAAMAAAAEGIRRELATALGSDLADRDAARARIAKLLAASVRHHEAQHGLDHDRDLAHPSVLASAIGGSPENAFSLRARHELSAYLSQIASDMWIPQLVLWNLSRHAFTGFRGRKVEEAYVAAIVIEQIAAELHIRAGGPVIKNGTIDRERLAELVAPIAARSTAEIRTAAAAAWTRLFERRLPRIVDR